LPPLAHWKLEQHASSSINRVTPFDAAVSQQEHSTGSGIYVAAW
jgi:hypothetical protein